MAVEKATGFHVLLSHRDDRTTVAGPFATLQLAINYAEGKLASGRLLGAEVTAPATYPAGRDENASQGIVARLRALAGL